MKCLYMQKKFHPDWADEVRLTFRSIGGLEDVRYSVPVFNLGIFSGNGDGYSSLGIKLGWWELSLSIEGDTWGYHGRLDE